MKGLRGFFQGERECFYEYYPFFGFLFYWKDQNVQIPEPEQFKQLNSDTVDPVDAIESSATQLKNIYTADNVLGCRYLPQMQVMRLDSANKQIILEPNGNIGSLLTNLNITLYDENFELVYKDMIIKIKAIINFKKHIVKYANVLDNIKTCIISNESNMLKRLLKILKTFFDNNNILSLRVNGNGPSQPQPDHQQQQQLQQHPQLQQPYSQQQQQQHQQQLHQQQQQLQQPPQPQHQASTDPLSTPTAASIAATNARINKKFKDLRGDRNGPSQPQPAYCSGSPSRSPSISQEALSFTPNTELGGYPEY